MENAEEDQQPISLHSDSMSDSILSSGDDNQSPGKLDDPIKQKMKNVQNYRRLSRYYKPALMTKNFDREMPLFLSEKNLDNLAHLFK